MDWCVRRIYKSWYSGGASRTAEWGAKQILSSAAELEKKVPAGIWVGKQEAYRVNTWPRAECGPLLQKRTPVWPRQEQEFTRRLLFMAHQVLMSKTGVGQEDWGGLRGTNLPSPTCLSYRKNKQSLKSLGRVRKCCCLFEGGNALWKYFIPQFQTQPSNWTTIQLRFFIKIHIKVYVKSMNFTVR